MPTAILDAVEPIPDHRGAGRVILLNGASSSGTSTLAKALQGALPHPFRIHFPSDATAPFISPALTGFGLPIDRTAAQRMPMPAIYRLRFTDLTANPEVSELA
jgi:chloramphenicol 3-O-phosphotransferase